MAIDELGTDGLPIPDDDQIFRHTLLELGVDPDDGVAIAEFVLHWAAIFEAEDAENGEQTQWLS
jgi:hypothetical protein